MAHSYNYPIEFGEYRLLRKLAQGGMAEIFLAQNRAGEFCAIKRILPHLAHEEGFIRMFIDEARIVSHLDHPNIAGVYDQGRHDGFYYIAMEFVQGHSLLAFTERAKATKMPLPLGLLSYVVAELLGGLGFAHSARDSKGRHLQIVHRDVTPQNVLISYEGDVKLIDFGVAKARARLTQTEAGFTKGKLSYMSPEQARGEELDGRSDLFSVGIILHEVTTNSRLFNKEGPGGILGAIVNEPIAPPSRRRKDYPSALETIVMKALEKEVEYRWQAAEEMRDALLRFARKERPAPSPSRLKELIYDLFGPPDSQEVIDAAQATSEPTPPQIAVRARPSVIEVANPPRSGSASSSRDTGRPREDETQMQQVGRPVNLSRVERDLRQVTSAGVPIIINPEDEELEVPEPELPWRVRVARYLAALSSDVQVSWRNQRGRWVGGIVAAASVFLLLIGAQTGALWAAGRWIGGAAERARSLKTSAGLDDRPIIDAGLRPTVLRLLSQPPGASIAVNGIGMGAVTPHDLDDLPLGAQLRIVLSLPGFRDVEEKIMLQPNQGVHELTLRLARMEGLISVVTDPPGAAVRLNGKATGRVTPAEFGDLKAGQTVTIHVEKKGFVPASKAVLVTDGATRRVSFALKIDAQQIPDGRISVRTSPSGCAVRIDERPVGASPVLEYEVRPGLKAVAVACENYAPQSRTVDVVPGRTRTLSFALTPNVFGYLSITPVPPDSEVTIGGRTVQAGDFIKVVPGRQVVEVVNRALRKQTKMSVDVHPNKRVRRTVNLLQ